MKCIRAILGLAALATVAAAAGPSEAVEGKDVNVVEHPERYPHAPPPDLADTLAAGITSRLGNKNLTAHFPFLPMLSHESFSLSLANIDINILNAALQHRPEITGKKVRATVIVPELNIVVDPYIAGGKIKAMPFVGESVATINIINLAVTFSFGHKSLFNYCVIPGSTAYNIGLDRLKVNFEHLNPGTDTGDMLNTFMSTLGKDIAAWVNVLFNEGGALHSVVDKVVGNVINGILNNKGIGSCPTTPFPRSHEEHAFGSDWHNMIQLEQILNEFVQKFLV